ncbi:hypothetical protein SAMD00019534_011270 [Acytostelium subglobosum LB1]|uniref:hypothetical protein n=1 Tax=Acytostelium subglobosum LB1 TaxID=1410327 RepID=UPI000644BA1D|nr:hypothetical protein SAMD00019534_011270 [Acytostelium subglobosum LB1]GAM17952.1 hypothetical protein SAMD00019534_011270 [Acytostelium subglobosum LB1]|eukprot:XP_012758548.1 hypothetical protein SAMD00019534_011270 [Acytostelium subglobosum LB1]
MAKNKKQQVVEQKSNNSTTKQRRPQQQQQQQEEPEEEFVEEVTLKLTKQQKKANRQQQQQQQDDGDDSSSSSNSTSTTTSTLRSMTAIDSPKLDFSISGSDTIPSGAGSTIGNIGPIRRPITHVQKKIYTQRELEEIRKANKQVLIKFIIFTILMFLVPFSIYFSFMDYGADYFGVVRNERTTYSGILALSGMGCVMVAYVVMAFFFEK